MDIVNDANELARRIRMLAYGGKAPEEVANKLQTIPGSQADLLTEGAELLYAYYDQLDDDGKTLVGQLYFHAADQEWVTFNGGARGTDNRSEQIVALVRRDLGEKGSGVAAKDAEWPEPQTNRRSGVDWRNPPKPES